MKPKGRSGVGEIKISPATDWWLGLAARGQTAAAKIRVAVKGVAAASFSLGWGKWWRRLREFDQP